MNLHQIQITYQPEEDRILCRTSFNEEEDDEALQEIRVWLTRRLVKGLWGGVIKALEARVTLDKPQAVHAAAELIDMERQASMQDIEESGSFDSAYDTNVEAYPIGEAPMLAVGVQFAVGADAPIRVSFLLEQDCGFEISLTQSAFHGFCKLLQDAVTAAEWDVTLELPSSSDFDVEHRVLN